LLVAFAGIAAASMLAVGVLRCAFVVSSATAPRSPRGFAVVMNAAATVEETKANTKP
jgi:hypothetical protein